MVKRSIDNRIIMEIVQKYVDKICENYKVHTIILFGSYAKGLAKPTSDIDLVITTDITGLAFFGMLDDFVCTLNKDIDLIREKDIIKGSLVDEEIKNMLDAMYAKK